MDSFQNLLRKLNIPTIFITVLYKRLNSFYEFTNVLSYNLNNLDSIKQQTRIGWDNFAHGRLSKLLTAYMSNHYR